MKTTFQSCICMIFFVFMNLDEGWGLSCYDCESTETVTCGESLPTVHDLEPIDCSENLSNPQFCIKKSGVYEGQIGTKRFCSARDFGNFCEWVMRPGDERQHRACVYTCTGDGCNGALPSTRAASLLPVLLATVTVFISCIL